MSNVRVHSCLRFIAAAAWLVVAQSANAQSQNSTGVLGKFFPQLGQSSFSGATVPTGEFAVDNESQRGPMARLIENPDQTTGAPPFALTDQTGTIQRYVEPVPGIELAAFVGQVVVVRHDTGSTLLASQLELPPQPLLPLAGDMNSGAATGELGPPSTPERLARLDGEVQQAQYVDNDDSTVQLVPDEMQLPDGASGAGGGGMPLEMIGQGREYPVYADQMGPAMMEGPGFGPQYCDPMQCGPGVMQPYQQPYPQPMMGVGPCPQCGGYHGTHGTNACAPELCQQEPPRSRFSADVELNLLRPQFSENVVGKLSEEYQFSPRIILAARGIGNFDGRARYWYFGNDVNVLSGGDVRFRFNVLDLEATHDFVGRRSQFTLGAGLRLAGIDLTDINDAEASGDFFGLTLAGDGLTPLGRFSGGYFGLVYGGRLSILTGDWGSDDNSLFVIDQERSDNAVVHELYAGVELARRMGRCNVRARLDFEMQNWHSDVLADDSDIESIGFLGPGFQIGVDF